MDSITAASASKLSSLSGSTTEGDSVPGVPSLEKTHIVQHQDFDLLQHLDYFVDSTFSDTDLEVLSEHYDDRSLKEALEIIQRAIEYHKGDPCLSFTAYKALVELSKGPSAGQTVGSWEAHIKFEALLIDEWSIYPEVRAVTRPIDEADPDGYESVRVYVIAIVWSCAGSCLSTFFAIRYPAISLGSIALQILIAYTGHLWVRLTNSRPWLFKEQMLATLIMSVGAGTPYSQDAIIAQSNNNFYGFTEAGSIGYIICLTLSSQYMGFGVAGILRNFLVYPVRCVWYGVLPSIAISRTLTMPDVRERVNGWTLLRVEFFWLMSLVFFAWYWVTNLLFTALAYFDWPAWIEPSKINLQAITGCFSGLALNPITSFDISIFQPDSMITPWYATVNSFLGTIISFFALVIIWFTNVRWTSYLPINTNGVYANTGGRFRVHSVLNSANMLDEAKYQAYSLPFWSAGNLVVYGAYFMLYPAMIVYAALNYGRIIVESVRLFFRSVFKNPGRALEAHNDRFSRKQMRYKEVPEWWFLSVLVISFALSIVTVEVYRFTSTPVWTIFFGAGLSLIFLVPTGYLYATTNTTFYINVLFELVIGLAIPGNGNALMVAKVYGANFMGQTDNYITNQVQAHYCGIAPRSLFRGQMLSTLCNTFVQSGLMYWQASGGITDMCDPENKQRLTCLDQQTYFSAAVQWGTVGPRRVLTGLYPGLKWCFLIGAVYPIPFWVVRRFWGQRVWPWTNSVNEMVVLTGALSWAPSNFMYTLPPVYIGAAFQWYIKNHYPRWWSRYTYLLYAGIQVGINYAALILFFSTEYTHIVNISWWGNNVQTSTKDYLQTAVRLAIPSKGYFGPNRGSFP